MKIKLAALAFLALGFPSADAAFNVKQFACAANPFGVVTDVSGLGNTNLCIVGSATVNLNCACAGGGGNCPTDTKKQGFATTFSAGISVEPKNGRVQTTFALPVSLTDAQCTPLSCPNGQTSKLVSFAVPSGGAQFAVCTTNAAAGSPCNCVDATPLATQTCGPASAVTFAGKHNSCAKLFP